MNHTFLDSILGMSKIVRFKVSWMGGWWQGSRFCFSYQNAFGSKSLELISNAFMDEEDWVNHDCTNLATKSPKKKRKKECYDDPCVCFMISCTTAIPFFDIHKYS